MFRFVIDESSWNFEGCSTAAVEEAIENLLGRLETAKLRLEEVALYDGFHAFDAVRPIPAEILFFENAIIQDPDLRRRVSRALDRLPYWSDEPAFEVSVGGLDLLAPSIAYAHHEVTSGHAVACLPLSIAGRAGPLDVFVERRPAVVHFVTSEAEHRTFFRSVIEVENVESEAFAELATSAFPELAWADDVWGGLRDFSKPFRDMRADLTRHLAALDTIGAHLFRESPPDERAPRLGSEGAPASNENGRALRNAEARRSRTRIWKGAERVFWWHTKLSRNVDRIHFLYDADADRIVIGVFIDHCYLPG